MNEFYCLCPKCMCTHEAKFSDDGEHIIFFCEWCNFDDSEDDENAEGCWIEMNFEAVQFTDVDGFNLCA